MRILGKRADGYHSLETIFQQVGLHDDIELIPTDGDIECVCENNNSLSGEGNLCWKAAHLLQERTQYANGVRITLLKRIPVGAGLGGGSSNAAVILAALNELWNLGMTQDELSTRAAGLGSDVPFFLKGGTAIGLGKGEQLSSIFIPHRYWFLLVDPKIEISTAWAYRSLKYDLTIKEKNCKFARLGTLLEKPQQWKSTLINDFEEVIFKKYSFLEEIKHTLYNAGAFYSSLSGSGACVYGIFSKKTQALKGTAQLPDSCQSYVIQPVLFGYNEIRRYMRKAKEFRKGDGEILAG